MEFNISGRNLTVPERFREYAEEKIDKVEQLGDKVQRLDAKVTKATNSRHDDLQTTVELTVLGRGPVIRAEAAASDKYGAFDLAFNKLLERLRRARDRKKVHRGRHRPTAVHEATASLEPASGSIPLHMESNNNHESQEVTEERTGYEIENDLPAGDSPVLIRRKVFPPVPLTLDDAVDNMELVGHDFYIFIDKETNSPSVVYRRRGWTYGVISLDEQCDGDETHPQEEILAYRSDDRAAVNV
ncbi:ribosome hibernation-promoting factor, HPF/YfiA family [Arthrobacter castelli]|uniref:ribosome hibernation-promoting factor, HPF/YfiA family n=1 Tax=Arthrobacter castelli TaxID=271431 RepID=UPI0003FF942A|nr:ribosome-associated translation inhibitor RaiA [Arthrobacter castelli]